LNLLKFRKVFIKIGEFWTTIAKNQRNFESKVEKNVNMFDEI